MSNIQHPTSNIQPNHIAIIMDGNGRWAQQRGLPRSLGHKQGAEAARRVVETAGDLGISYLTLFGFSSENWSRPAEEVGYLMKLLRHYLRAETAELHRRNVRLRVLGERSVFEKDITRLIENAETLTHGNTGLTLNIALNYGGRMDIAQAARQIARTYLDHGHVPDSETVELDLADSLMTADMPDPDLLIRSSGEQRISNFLLWQCAYAEMIFTPILWPDFDGEVLKDLIADYAGRDRRFGGLQSYTDI